jgi:hypothetical protein
MILYASVRKRPSGFKSLTGLTVAQFDALFVDFQKAHLRRVEQATQKGTPRQRAYGGGDKAHLCLRNQLLMTLAWLRIYPTYEVLGLLFDLHKSNAFRNTETVLATLDQMATFHYERPKRERKALGSLKQVMDLFPDVRLIIDAKEQRIERPKGYANQKPYYSGKKKTHTLKTQICALPDGHVAHVSDSVPGSKSDLTLLRETNLLNTLDPDEQTMQDRGYIGIRDDYPNLRLLLPYRAGRGHPLTEQQQLANHVLSSYRITVEHTYAQLSRFQVLSQRFRNKLSRHNQAVRVVAGIVNRCLDEVPLKTYAPA